MSNIGLDRVPPQNIDAERAVLGAMMMAGENKAAIISASAILSAKMFYKEASRCVYQAILDQFETGEAVDLLTITARLVARDELEKVGGVSNLDEMIEGTPTAANAEYYSQLVYDEWLRREVIAASAKAYNEAFDGTVEMDDLLAGIQKEMLNLSTSRTGNGIISAKSTLKEVFAHVQKLYYKEESIVGLSSGFSSLDDRTAGFQDSDFIIVAGRPGMGKSVLVQNIIQHVSIEQKIPSMLFTLEASADHFVMRMLATEARMSLHAVRTGAITDNKWPALTMAAGRISESPIWIDETAGIKPSQIRSKIARKMLDCDLGLIVVDYLQLMSPDGKCDGPTDEITKISGALKGIAKEFRIPLIACSQLSRAVEQRTDRRPMLSDLRQSGSLEQDADLVLFLYRDSYYSHDNKDNTAELRIGKQKNGPCGTIGLYFNTSQLRFYELEQRMAYNGREEDSL